MADEYGYPELHGLEESGAAQRVGKSSKQRGVMRGHTKMPAGCSTTQPHEKRNYSGDPYADTDPGLSADPTIFLFL